MPDKHGWVVPTLAGVSVAIIRRFRRAAKEPWRVVITRFIAHAVTCLLAGYVVGGVLVHFQLYSLVAPVCALAGLYGTILVDWIEESGFMLVTAYVKSKIEK